MEGLRPLLLYMKKLLDYNPLTGVSTYFEATDDETSYRFVTEQDCSAIFERNLLARNDDDKTKRGIKQDWWKYANVPNVIIEKMRTEDGVDFFAKADAKRVFELLDSKYSKCKTTTKKHRPK